MFERRSFLRDCIATTVCLLILFPFLWMIATALKSPGELASANPTLIPLEATMQNFIDVFTRGNFGTYFLNSVIVSAGTTIVAVVVACLSGYAFARFTLPGGKFALLFIVASQMFPSLLLLMPLYDLLQKIGLLNTHLGLVLVYTTFALPFSVWMLRNYFITIPPELDEAALIDGCTRLQALFKVVIPSAKPGIVAVAVFTIILSWDDFIYANTFISSDSQRTLTVALQGLIGEFGTNWGLLMAGAVVAALPIMVLFGFFEKQLTSMVGGGVKG